MGRKSLTSGVQPKGTHRIQFDFEFEGVRYRPTLERVPNEANLRRALKQLADIKHRISAGTFNFEEEFPDYRYKKTQLPQPEERTERTCNEVFKKFFAHCEMRVEMNDMAFSTLEGYRDILNGVFAPEIGEEPFESIVYSRLADILAGHTKKKTYNNLSSAVRTAFKFGYKDLPGKFNPALALTTFRITKKDRPAVDPFTVPEAESIISAAHREFGEAYGNYEEFRFFTSLRQSEQFALEVSDCDLVKGTIRITKVVVLARDKNRTKTNLDREIALCPRAFEVLRAQLALREQMVAAGRIKHRRVFFLEDGSPFETVYLPYNRWQKFIRPLGVRYRKPYNSRHTFISWRLMKGDNPLLVAQEDGHSVDTMLRTYAAWIKGAKPEDIECIKKAMEGRPQANEADVNPPKSPGAGTRLAPEGLIEGRASPESVIGGADSEAVTSCFTKEKGKKSRRRKVAGVAGFEPTYGGIKTQPDDEADQ